MRTLRNRLLNALPWLLLIVSLALYLSTMAPTISWEHDGYDAGDLITAAYTLGIPHPTGYPTYMLLAKAFASLPVGDIAYRINLLSAVCAAATVVLLYSAGQELLPETPQARLASFCAAMLLATSRIFWSQALITEVYALNCLFFAATLCLSVRLARCPSAAVTAQPLRVSLWTAWLYGLSLGNHLTIAFSAPLILYHFWSTSRHRASRLMDWARVLGALLLGLAVYLYLPLRVGRQALFNWGNPADLRGFLWVVSGGIYRQYVLALPAAYWGDRLLAWAGLLREQFGLWGTALGLLGAWVHLRRNARQFAILALTFALYSLYAGAYNTTDSYVYLLPVYFLFALWIAWGALHLLHAFAGAPGKWSTLLTLAVALALLALPIGSLRRNLPLVDLHNDHTAYDYGSQVLAQVPDNSLLISATDPHTFTLWYFLRVVTGRDAVALVDRDLLGYDWYVDGLRRSYPWLDFPVAPSGLPPSVGQLVEANLSSRDVFLTDPDPALLAHYAFQQQEGPLYRLLPKESTAP